jgi:hypothetical protein
MSSATTFKLQMTFSSCQMGLQTTIFLSMQETKTFTNIFKIFITEILYISYFYVKIFPLGEYICNFIVRNK